MLMFSFKESITPDCVLSLRPKHFKLGVQQDSAEYLNYLLNLLVDKDAVVQQHFGGEWSTIMKCAECNTESSKSYVHFIQELFPCKVSDSCSTQLLLEKLFETEHMTTTEQYRCDVCEKLCDSQRNILLKKAPSNLILQLNTYNFNNLKMKREKLFPRIYIDKEITLRERCSSEADGILLRYELYAVIVHVGTDMDSGHYYTYAKNNTNEWFKFNDSQISRTSFENINKRSSVMDTPYLLFYSKINPNVCGDDMNGKNMQFEDLKDNIKEFVNNKNMNYCQEFAKKYQILS